MGAGYDVVDGGRLGVWHDLLHRHQRAPEYAARDLAPVTVSLGYLPEGVTLCLQAPLDELDPGSLSTFAVPTRCS
jgi:hypothetical protein